ncbi:hypothetical protein GF318_06090 [Candidatus Micrarchaeota archaeon]|nr:hypothetical protein [Candidatus Micrarchaeota archaeon]
MMGAKRKTLRSTKETGTSASRKTINPFSQGGREMLEQLDSRCLQTALASPRLEERKAAVQELGGNKSALKKVAEETRCPETRQAAEAYLYAFQ